MLPPFNEHGLLEPGEYELTLKQLRSSFLVQGPSNASSRWDNSWRSKLVDNAQILIHQLWDIGVTEIFLDGSFVEDKDNPNDIDGYFETGISSIVSGSLTRDLNALDEYKVWTWNPRERRAHPGFAEKQLPMWHHYRVEFYPHYGQLCGIQDEYGNELTFPSAFRTSRRDGKPKGIIKIGGQP